MVSRITWERDRMNQKNRSRNSVKKGKWIFSLSFHFPAFVLYTVFLILPMLGSLYFSLLKWDGITTARFIGIKNFVDLFTRDRYFKKVIFNTVKSMVAGVCIQLPLAMVLAYLVYRTTRGFHFFQSVYFVPVVISATVIGLMFSLFFNPSFGPVNAFFQAVGLKGLIRNWLTDPGVVLFSVIMPGIWQYMGYHFIIFLAGMQSMPKEIMESAYIDGANSVSAFFHIVIPNIKGMIQVCLVICLTGTIKTFDIPYLMTQGGPGAESTFLSIYMYKEAFVDSSIGRGTAVAVCMLVLALMVTFVVNGIFAFLNRKD